VSSPAIGDRLCVLGAAFLFSTGGVAIKSTDLDGWEVAGLRSALAALAVWALVPGRAVLGRRAVFLTGVAQGATMLLFVLANKLTTAANTIFLQSAAPLYLPFLVPRILGEAVTRRDIAAMVGIAAGMALFFVGTVEPTATATNPRLGDALAIVSGFTWACTVVGLRYFSRDGAAASASTKGAMIWGNLLVAAIALPIGLPLGEAGATDALVLLYLGVVQVGFGYRLLVRGMRTVPALEAALLVLFEPVLSPVWAYLVLGEAPTSHALAGAAILGMVIAMRSVAGAKDTGVAAIPVVVPDGEADENGRRD